MQTDISQDSDSSRTRNVKFTEVKVFYFDREQSLCSAPSDGDAALGMGMKHFAEENVSVDEREEHHLVQRFVTAGKLLRKGIVQLPKWVHTKLKPFTCTQATNLSLSLSPSQLATRSPGKRKLTDTLCKAHVAEASAADAQSDDDAAMEAVDSTPNGFRKADKARRYDSPLRMDKKMRSYFEDKSFTYQMDHEERKRLLLDASMDCESETGNVTCDSIVMKDENDSPVKRSKQDSLCVSSQVSINETESSEEAVGCTCLNGECNPQTCECAKNGIQCLVDREIEQDSDEFNSDDSDSDSEKQRPKFPPGTTSPCQCGWKPCKNPEGKRAFDYERVLLHYQHTLSKQREEKRATSRQKAIAKRKGLQISQGEANLLDLDSPAASRVARPDNADLSFDFDCSICKNRFDVSSNKSSQTKQATAMDESLTARTSTPKRKKNAQTKSRTNDNSD